MKETYYSVIDKCKAVFIAKHEDYGFAWRVMRKESLLHMILIKAKRLRTIQENKVQKVADTQEGELVAIVNYCIMALLYDKDLSDENLETAYETAVKDCFFLYSNKTHDYGDAWKDMNLYSLTDTILMKVLRLKKYYENEETFKVSENDTANYQDMLNYAIFAFIHLKGNVK